MRQRQIGRLAGRHAEGHADQVRRHRIEAGGLGIEGGESAASIFASQASNCAQSTIPQVPAIRGGRPARPGASQSARLRGMWSRPCPRTHRPASPEPAPEFHALVEFGEPFLVVLAREQPIGLERQFQVGRHGHQLLRPSGRKSRCLRRFSPTLPPTSPARAMRVSRSPYWASHFTAVLGPHFSTPGRCPRYRRPAPGNRRCAPAAPRTWPRRRPRRALPRSWY